MHHSTLGLRVMKEKKKFTVLGFGFLRFRYMASGSRKRCFTVPHGGLRPLHQKYTTYISCPESYISLVGGVHVPAAVDEEEQTLQGYLAHKKRPTP